MNDLKEEMKEQDDEIDSPKTMLNNTIADVKAEMNDNRTN